MFAGCLIALTFWRANMKVIKHPCFDAGCHRWPFWIVLDDLYFHVWEQGFGSLHMLKLNIEAGRAYHHPLLSHRHINATLPKNATTCAQFGATSKSKSASPLASHRRVFSSQGWRSEAASSKNCRNCQRKRCWGLEKDLERQPMNQCIFF